VAVKQTLGLVTSTANLRRDSRWDAVAPFRFLCVDGEPVFRTMKSVYHRLTKTCVTFAGDEQGGLTPIGCSPARVVSGASCSVKSASCTYTGLASAVWTFADPPTNAIIMLCPPQARD
jgi:hypothetical protein